MAAGSCGGEKKGTGGFSSDRSQENTPVPFFYSESREHDLPAMGVATEDQRDVERGGLAEPARIVSEQDGGGRRAAENPGQHLDTAGPKSDGRPV